MKRASRKSSNRKAVDEESADARRLDGNAAAGILSELFAPDLTAARAKCGGCSLTQTIGALFVYAHGMGMVVRCPQCDGVILRVVRTPTHMWLDATGATSIVIPSRQFA